MSHATRADTTIAPPIIRLQKRVSLQLFVVGVVSVGWDVLLLLLLLLSEVPLVAVLFVAGVVVVPAAALPEEALPVELLLVDEVVAGHSLYCPLP